MIRLNVTAVDLVNLWRAYQAWRRARRSRAAVVIGKHRDPSERVFRSLADQIETAMLALEKDHAGNDGRQTKTASKTKSFLHELIYALDEMNVPHPPFADAVHTWLVFLSRLLAASRVGDLDWAKRIWPEIEAESHQNNGQNNPKVSSRTTSRDEGVNERVAPVAPVRRTTSRAQQGGMNRVREMRYQRRLTQEGLASRAGMTAASISRIERGERDISISQLQRIAGALDCDPRDLLP